jgi:hypothetical protein
VLQNFEISSCCEPRAGSTDAAQLPQRRRKHKCPVFVMMPLDTVFVRPAQEGDSGGTASDVRSSIGASVSDVQTPEAVNVALHKIKQAKVQARSAAGVHASLQRSCCSLSLPCPLRLRAGTTRLIYDARGTRSSLLGQHQHDAALAGAQWEHSLLSRSWLH